MRGEASYSSIRLRSSARLARYLAPRISTAQFARVASERRLGSRVMIDSELERRALRVKRESRIRAIVVSIVVRISISVFSSPTLYRRD